MSVGAEAGGSTRRSRAARSVRPTPPRPSATQSHGGPLLEPAFLARLERLQLATRRPLAGRLVGEHRSPARGSSVDFADYREYTPGDDFRRVDYALFARLDVLLVRLFEAEDDLHLRLLVDTSASMGGSKLHQAARLAAALGFVALVRRDPVSVHSFPFATRSPRFRGRNAVPALFAHLAALEAEGETPFADAAAHALGRSGPVGLTVVVSDLLTPEWDAGISRLPSRGGDVVIVHVLADDELRPSRSVGGELVGDLDLVDAETGRRVAVSLSSDTLADYERSALRWADEVATRCRLAGAAYVRVMADDDIEPLLFGRWRTQGFLR